MIRGSYLAPWTKEPLGRPVSVQSFLGEPVKVPATAVAVVTRFRPCGQATVCKDVPEIPGRISGNTGNVLQSRAVSTADETRTRPRVTLREVARLAGVSVATV